VQFKRSFGAGVASCCVSAIACQAVAQTSLRAPPSRGSDVPDCAQFATFKHNVSYPREQLRKRVEGWVAFSYKLAGDGVASDIRLVDSEPKDVFVPAASAAFEQWRFREGAVQNVCLHVVIFNVR
jgi:outer membrane biosynthesis protein TonB